MRISLSHYVQRARTAPDPPLQGTVEDIVGLLVEVSGIVAAVGDQLEARIGESTREFGRPLPLEVVGFRGGRLLAAPLGPPEGLRPGTRVRCVANGGLAPVGDALLGRVVDAFGEPLDGGARPRCDEKSTLRATPPSPLSRPPITRPLETGVRALDALLPLGLGQRVGLFAGTGVGKSTLLGMLCRRAKADVVVVGLIGERGREVGDFVRDTLGPSGLGRAVVVAATSDAPPLVRARGALYASTIAEHFRDRGKNVLLLVDSVTRYAMAIREASLAAGEPPVTKGYTPSVFASLPRLLERAGPSASGGTITAVYTVLVEGGDLDEPIADAVRGILDGHVVLTRALAEKGHFPAIDVLKSISRVSGQVSTRAHTNDQAAVRACLSAHADAQDLLSLGAYVKGSDPRVDCAVRAMPAVEAFLRQDVSEVTPRAEALAVLAALARDAR